MQRIFVNNQDEAKGSHSYCTAVLLPPPLHPRLELLIQKFCPSYSNAIAPETANLVTSTPLNTEQFLKLLKSFTYFIKKDMCLPPPPNMLGQLANFHDSWYEHHVTRSHLFVFLHFLPSVIPKCCRANFWDGCYSNAT
jgi:hypothetical protein